MTRRYRRTTLVAIVGVVLSVVIIVVVLRSDVCSEMAFAWGSYAHEKRSSSAIALHEEGASAKELTMLVGQPDDVILLDGGRSLWVYNGPVCDGFARQALLIDVDSDTGAILSIAHTYRDGPCSLYSKEHLNRIKWIQKLLLRVLGDPHKAAQRE